MGAFAFLFGLVVFVIIVWGIGSVAQKGLSKEEDEKKEKVKSLLSKFGNSNGTWQVTYLGGHPSYHTKNCTMKFFEEVVILLDYTSERYVEIFYKDISDVELVSKEYITQSPTLGKFLLFGVASLAMQKEKVHTNNFIVITYSDSGINNKVILQSDDANNLYGAINRRRIEFNKKHGLKSSKDNSRIDVTEQIRKLSELKDEGILTEDEFQEKKKELLSKI